MSQTIEIDREKLAPCDYCRRCAIHDDPAGCLEVEAYEREMVALGAGLKDLYPNAEPWVVAWWDRTYGKESG